MLRGMGEEYVQDNGKNGESCSKGGGGIRGGGIYRQRRQRGPKEFCAKKVGFKDGGRDAVSRKGKGRTIEKKEGMGGPRL
jgi:hypothetical protein